MITKYLNLCSIQDEFRDEALLRLLKGERFSECDSIIVYCTRRDECVRLATLIRTKLQVTIMSIMTQIRSIDICGTDLSGKPFLSSATLAGS